MSEQKFNLSKAVYTDDARGGRAVPVKLYIPEGEGPHPLVLWSHGLGGTRDGAGFIARALANAGIMVVNIQHDGTDDCLWRGKTGHPWDNIKAAKIENETLIARWTDTPFVLDRILDEYNIDRDRIGYGGHSLGALSVQVLSGQLWPNEQGVLTDYSDPRFSHGLLYSPVPSLSIDHPSAVFENIHKPVLYMTGTNDVSPLSGYGYEERFRVFDNAIAADRIMVVLNEADHMVFSGSRGQLPSYKGMDEHEAQIEAMSLSYWQSVFAGKSMDMIAQDMKTILNAGGTVDYRSGDASLAA
jgi:pimeloyl-ACP methyl ester carboxylesterase